MKSEEENVLYNFKKPDIITCKSHKYAYHTLIQHAAVTIQNWNPSP